MENNHIHDPLEDYFRRTLDNHEAAPPAGLWERVAAELPPSAAPPRSWWAVHRFAFVAGAITMLLLLALLDATGHLHRQRTKTLEGVAQTPAPPGIFAEKPAAPLQASPFNPDAQQPPAVAALPHPAYRSGPVLPKAEPTSALHGHGFAAADAPVHVPLETDSVAEYAPNPTELSAAQPTDFDRPADVRASEQASATGTLAGSGASELSALPVLPHAVDARLRPADVPLPAQVPTRPARLLSDWSVGLYVSSLQVPSASTSVAQSRFPQRMLFVSVPQPTRPAWEGGLRIRKRIGSRWGLEAGLSYSEQARSTAYISRFRFGDGRPTPGGGHSPRREYAHYLNTPGGTATVDFRMEPADASDPIPQGEIIRVRATFTERTSLLRLPILASYSIGSGRLFGITRAGVVADIFLRNDLQLSSFISENARVRLATGMRPAVEWTPARNVSFGYWLSAGAVYRLNRHMALSAEPVLTGRFSHRDARGQPLPTPAAFGGQVGVWYGW